MTDGGDKQRPSRKVAIVAASVPSILRLRRDLVEAMSAHHRVLCLAPAADAQDVKALIGLGVEYREIDFEPAGWKLLRNIRVVKTLADIFKEWQPDVAVGIGPGPLVYNALAAKRLRVPLIASVCTELPDFLRETVDKTTFTVKSSYKAALSASHRIVVQNHDHGQLMVREGVVPPGLGIDVVAGVGVDLDEVAMRPLPPFDEGIVFLMVARRDVVKGISDFVAASKRVAARAKGAKFVLAGPPGRDDFNPVGLGFGGDRMRYEDHSVDIGAELEEAHVYVYPSHSEGMPPSVLEALASGRPVITTDTPGCRETVDEKVNGCLFPRGNVIALTDAMESFLKRPDLISSMARASRLKAERRFSRSVVNGRILGLLGL